MTRITTIIYDFFTSAHIQIFFFLFDLTFLIISSHIVFISIHGLFSRSLSPNICTDSLRCLILQCSALSIISTSSHKGRWFPFSFHIWSTISDFSISPQTTAFQCPSSLLVGDLSHLCIFYYNCKGWSKHSSWSCWIPLVAWPGRDKSCYICTWSITHKSVHPLQLL